MDLPKRKSPRIPGFDYSSVNYYFVTICTHDKQCIFGDPGDFIDERKQQKIIKTAQYYAVKNGIYDTPMRFDAVLINAGKKKSNAEVIKDAFRV